MSRHREPAQDASGESRSRILAAALELFGAKGYRSTSMREIADHVGLTKATLYHHFASKSELVHGLLDPLLERLEGLVPDEEQDASTADAARERFLSDCVGAMLAHRAVLVLLLRDTSVYTDEVVIASRAMAWMEHANRLLAGPEADWQDRIRASQAIAAIADPLTLSLAAPDEVLRAELLAGARLLLRRPER